MKWFSQRKGLKKIRTEIQIESMDSALQNKLWNLLKIYYWDKMSGEWISNNRSLEVLFTGIWHNYFKKPLDEMPRLWDTLYKYIRSYFFGCSWDEIYEFLEVVVYYYENEYGKDTNNKFQEACNIALEGELSAYRFVKGKIIENTSKVEISEIEEAMESPLKVVNTHLENALRLMTDKKKPDYRNSIKESISAIEATCNLISNRKVTLGQCLKELKKNVGLHGALEKAFSNLYGYTSVAEGIRHGLLDEPTVNYEDAKFMLVACSAFVNYLVSKGSKAGIIK